MYGEYGLVFLYSLINKIYLFYKNFVIIDKFFKMFYFNCATLMSFLSSFLLNACSIPF